MDLHIAGRVALVCGSSSGMGLAVGRALADAGCRVVLNGRDAARLERAVADVRQHVAREVVGFRADVSVPDQAAALVERVRHELGSVDILLCNAAGPAAAPFHDTPAENWALALALNLLSTIHLCRAAVPIMRKRGWGRIICLTSIAARQPLAGLILSSTARAGVHGFAKSLADEVADEGITVNVVAPGYIRTPRTEELAAARAARSGSTVPEVVAGLVGDIPLGRMGEPEEVAAAIAFLASEPARYITGAVLQVDGGFTRSIW
ncbi:MAG: SDR family oxidoreductase [Gemmatimonadota bacterium]|nr:SDR family oxidoreductase [Gemmatimonadota bacterium]